MLSRNYHSDLIPNSDLNVAIFTHIFKIYKYVLPSGSVSVFVCVCARITSL